MSSITLYQPVLPLEGTFTEAEISFMDDSPPGLFPENQNSNFGLILRKIYTAKIQELIGQQSALYAEDFVGTSVQYLDMWEQDYGLPVAPAGRSVAQRRQDVLSRIQVGPFTRSRRAAAVENFITPTFGAGALLFSAGLTIGSGIPLYSGVSSLAGTYVIRENYTWKNLIANSSFETNTAGYSPGPGCTLVRDTTQAKYGSASGKITVTTLGTSWCYTPAVALTGATAGRVYTVSSYLYGTGTMIGKPVTLALRETGGASGDSETDVNFTVAAGWQRISTTRTLVQNDRTALTPYFNFAGVAVNDFCFVDGVQVELGAVATDWSDPAGQDFFYEVRILNSVTPDLVALTRELTRITPAGISFVITSTPSP